MTVPPHARVPNRTLRAARLTLRLSQSEFAAAVRRAGVTLGEPNDCTKRLVQKWESGEHNDCRPRYQRALQLVTRTPFEELGFRASHVPSPVVMPPVVRPVLEPLNGYSGAGRLTLEPADRLRLALERPGRADAETVRVAQADMEQLFALEQHRPASSVSAVANRHTAETARLLAGTRSEALRRRLASIGGASAALAGWLALERGDVAGAHRCWDGALAAANHTADGSLMACVLGYLSYAAAERGDGPLAWRLAHSAMAHTGDDVRARALMAVRSAQEAARLGERDAALELLRSVRELGWSLGPARPGDGTAAWARFVDGAFVAGLTAGVYGELGEADQAQEAARFALSGVGSGRTKARALTLAEVAHAASRVGDFEMVERTVFEAVDLALSLEALLAHRVLCAVVVSLRWKRDVVGLQLARKLAAELGSQYGGVDDAGGAGGAGWGVAAGAGLVPD